MNATIGPRLVGWARDKPVARVPPALAPPGQNPAGRASSAGPEGAQRPGAGARAASPDFSKFAIGFDERARPRLHELWDGVIDSQRWSEGPLTDAFEQAWASHNGLPAVAFGGWSGGALAALEFADVRGGETVLVPSNTFMATPLAVLHAGGKPEFVDCNREDLCMSFEDFERKVAEHKPKAAILVHIGGEIAFDSRRDGPPCPAGGMFLIQGWAPAPRASRDGA